MAARPIVFMLRKDSKRSAIWARHQVLGVAISNGSSSGSAVPSSTGDKEDHTCARVMNHYLGQE